MRRKGKLRHTHFTHYYYYALLIIDQMHSLFVTCGIQCASVVVMYLRCTSFPLATQPTGIPWRAKEMNCVDGTYRVERKLEGRVSMSIHRSSPPHTPIRITVRPPPPFGREMGSNKSCLIFLSRMHHIYISFLHISYIWTNKINKKIHTYFYPILSLYKNSSLKS
jgi:hypothetical protein